jgi:putative glutathione S-transferase
MGVKVYKAGFATSQKAYEEAVIPLFEGLDRIEKILSDGRDYLVGGRLTEADVRWVTAF